MHIAFLGLGIMGQPMVMNLIQAGYTVTVWNRSPHKTTEACTAGAIKAEHPAAAAAGADVVLTMLTDTPDVEAVLFTEETGVSAGVRAGSLVIDMSTINPDDTRVFHQRLSKQGVQMLDAPVSGGDVGAAAGTLSIMVGGDAAAFAKALPIFEILGSRITHVGPSGAGQVIKACNQVCCAVNMVGLCEALALAKASGLDGQVVLDVLSGGAAQSWALEHLGAAIVADNFDPGFMVDLMQKDLGIVLNTSTDAGLSLPGVSLAHQQFGMVQENGAGTSGTQAMIHCYY